MNLENTYHISSKNEHNYPFEIGEIYEFKYKDEVIVSMFQGLSRIDNNYTFFAKLDNMKHGISNFSYDYVFMDSVCIETPLNNHPDIDTSTDIIENDKHNFMVKYREYKIDSVL